LSRLLDKIVLFAFILFIFATLRQACYFSIIPLLLRMDSTHVGALEWLTKNMTIKLLWLDLTDELIL
jgi:hypothetical protein